MVLSGDVFSVYRSYRPVTQVFIVLVVWCYHVESIVLDLFVVFWLVSEYYNIIILHNDLRSIGKFGFACSIADSIEL